MKKFICAAAAMLLVFMPATCKRGARKDMRFVGTLAQAMLSDKAKAGVQSILGTATLASVSNWADQIRPTSRRRITGILWTFRGAPRPLTDARDCFKPTDTHPGAATDHMNCVVDRITFFSRCWRTRLRLRRNGKRRCKFIVHFVGDVHQPFHAVGDARGANDNLITEFGSTQCGSRPCNLHSAWDSG